MKTIKSCKSFYCTVKHSCAVSKFNRLLYSPWVIVLWGLMTFVAFAYSKELTFYTFVMTYALYVIAFCDDLAPIMPLFLLCYIASSPSNNPGMSEEGLFYGESGRTILHFAAFVVIALIIRITFDRNIGWKTFFTKRRKLIVGMLALGISYVASGIGSEYYSEYAYKNIAFALIQFASIFLLYFIFSATVQWEKFNMDYFACSGLVAGFVVLAELVYVIFTQDVMVSGAVERGKIYTGWGMYNNMGAIMATAIPFAFYFAKKQKNNWIYLLLAVVLVIGAMFSCSRNSIVFASLVFLLSYVFTLIKAGHKKSFIITSVFLVLLSVGGCLIFNEKMIGIFEKVPSIADILDGDLILNDSGRLNIYKEGFEIFLENPVIGQGFYSYDYELSDFSTVESFSNFFPPRWHNTIIQLLATSGILGLLAYLYHRCQTVCLFIKRRSAQKAYIGLYLFVLLGMSLLDCHFFNVGPTLFYSMALAVVEYAEHRDAQI